MKKKVFSGKNSCKYSVLYFFCVAIVACVVLAFLIPLFSAYLSLFFNDTSQVAEKISNFFFDVRFKKIILFSILQALLSVGIALLLAIPAAYFLANKKFLFSGLLNSLSAISFCVPSLLIALSFVLFYGRQGFVNQFLMLAFSLKEPPVTFLYSFWGVVFTHGIYNFPIIMGTVATRWRMIPCEQENAAYLLKASRLKVFRTVVFPQIKPAIISASVLVFLYCFFSFGILILFGGFGFSTLEVELYYTIRTRFDFSLGAIIAIFETLIGLGIVVIQFLISRKTSDVKEFVGTIRSPQKIKSFTERVFLILFLIIIGIVFCGPLLALILSAFKVKNGYSQFSNWGIDNFVNLFSRKIFWKSLCTTLIVSFFSATLATLCAIILGKNQKKVFFKVLTMLPMAVSGIILGLGWANLVSTSNVFVLVFAQSSLFFPIALRQVQSGFEKIPQAIKDSAILLSATKSEAFFRVCVPQIKNSIFVAWCFVFAASAGDISLPLVLGIPDFNSLSLLLYKLAGSYRFGEACCAGIILGLISCIAWIGLDKLNSKKQEV